MDEDIFWRIVARACIPDPMPGRLWARRLKLELKRLAPDEIIAWDLMFCRYVADACTWNLLGASTLINGTWSHDVFYYFRCWLVGMGSRVYRRAILDADSLADAVGRGTQADAEIYWVPHIVWMKLTGNSESVPYPGREEITEFLDTEWDVDDPAEQRIRLPRLSAIFLK